MSSEAPLSEMQMIKHGAVSLAIVLVFKMNKGHERYQIISIERDETEATKEPS